MKKIISEYPRIDTIIQGLEMKKDNLNYRDINAFIRCNNKINRITEIQAINSAVLMNKLKHIENGKS